jgi:hypothetical protein
MRGRGGCDGGTQAACTADDENGLLGESSSQFLLRSGVDAQHGMEK